MTAPITDYATYDDIRAALGVEVEEIADTTLALDLYANTLEVELEDIDVTLPATYATKALVVSPTEAESRFLRSCRLFATYAVAKHLTDTVQLFAPMEITDGKSALNRVGDPHSDVVASVHRQYGRFRSKLIDALAEINSSAVNAAVVKPYFKSVSPSSDPVTGS